jgi:cytochrome c-type biogenesis protein CcmH
MDPSAYKPVGRAPKPNARPQLTAEQRDALEHTLKCQCPCTLDVYTCRTTDFSCGVSPAMHQDVMRLVDGGHSADEIIAAFQSTYGERVLMAPVKKGFNLAGYAMPFAALGGGAVVVATLMRRWSQRAAAVAAAARAEHAERAATNGHGAYNPLADATPDELAQLEAAVRGGGDDH